ncbi:MAG: sigma-70 family RNA polymerase sigma factor [Anaerolineae bacterium]|nr:sigma-70 family RNA polymerase sigma factor [Anaerolineae bacterium]
MIPSTGFDSIFDEYHSKLYAYVLSRVTQREIAEDITAMTFERAFNRRDTYDPNRGSLATWLFRIARNLIIDHYAYTSRKPPPDPLDETQLIAATPSPEQVLVRQEEYSRLREMIARLSDRDQEILYLRFYGRLTNREIARIMELKEKTVSVIILRALRKLRTYLEGQTV